MSSDTFGSPVMPRPTRYSADESCWVTGCVVGVMVIGIVIVLMVILSNPRRSRHGSDRRRIEKLRKRKASTNVPQKGTRKSAQKPPIALPAPSRNVFTRGKSVVAFTAPWCGHCKAMKPALAEAAAKSSVKFYEISHKSAGDLLAKYSIKGFPEVIRFENGRATKYSGDRSASSLVKFAAESSAVAAPKKIQDDQVRANIMDADEPVVVFAFADWCGWSNKTMPNVLEANAQTRTPFFLVEEKTAPVFMKHHNVRGYPTILKFHKGKVVDTYQGDRSAQSIIEWAGP